MKLLIKNILRWINIERRKKGFPPRKEIEQGQKNSEETCPIANTLKAGTDECPIIDSSSWGWWDRSKLSVDMEKLPDYVARFINLFDDTDKLDYLDMDLD